MMMVTGFRFALLLFCFWCFRFGFALFAGGGGVVVLSTKTEL
jgi:hypothetical protein